MKEFNFYQKRCLFDMLLKYLSINIVNQFLFGVSYVHRTVETVVNMMFFDMFDSTVMYSVAHDIIDPYTKVYSHRFLPFFVSINYNTWGMTVSSHHHLFEKPLPNNFYHNCLIQDRMFKYVLSNSPYKKLTSDFKKMDYLSIDIEEPCGSKSFPYLDNVFTDIQLTADHLCTFATTFLGSKVVCLNQDLDEIVFKDTDIIHSNPCNQSDSQIHNDE